MTKISVLNSTQDEVNEKPVQRNRFNLVKQARSGDDEIIDSKDRNNELIAEGVSKAVKKGVKNVLTMLNSYLNADNDVTTEPAVLNIGSADEEIDNLLEGIKVKYPNKVINKSEIFNLYKKARTKDLDITKEDVYKMLKETNLDSQDTYTKLTKGYKEKPTRDLSEEEKEVDAANLQNEIGPSDTKAPKAEPSKEDMFQAFTKEFDKKGNPMAALMGDGALGGDLLSGNLTSGNLMGSVSGMLWKGIKSGMGGKVGKVINVIMAPCRFVGRTVKGAFKKVKSLFGKKN